MQISRRATALAALIAPALAPTLAIAHTGADGGAHHSFLDALLYAVSDLSLPAMLAALAIWGAIFAASHAKKRKPQTLRETVRSNSIRNTRKP